MLKDIHGLKKSRAVPPELHDLGSCVKVVEDDNAVVRGPASELAVVPSESAASSAAAETSATLKTPPTTAHNCVTKSANDSFVSSYATLTGDT